MGNRKKIKKKPDQRPTRADVIRSLQEDFAWLESQEAELKNAEDARGSNDLSV